MSIVDSLKRLERAGAEDSKATKKLIEACQAFAGHLCDTLPRDIVLPRGYEAHTFRSNIGAERFLIRENADPAASYPDDVEPTLWFNADGGYLHGDFNCVLGTTTREAAWRLAYDVANGWIDELATFCEQRTREATAQTSILVSAQD